MLRTFSLLLVALMVSTATADANLLKNGDFEQGLTGWNIFWSRSGGGSAQLATQHAQQGKQAVHIKYAGKEDWSFPQTESLAVKPGDIYELTGWIRIQGEGSASLSVILYDADHQALAWDFGGRPNHEVAQWQEIRTRFMIPPEGKTITPRLMGLGPAEIWLDHVSLVKSGTVADLQNDQLPKQLAIESSTLRVTFAPRAGTISLLDKRTKQEFTQQPSPTLVVLDARVQDNRITFEFLKPDDVLTIKGSIELTQDAPEFVIKLNAAGEMRQQLAFPLPFRTQPGQYLIMPVNEGISYPVDDKTLPTMQYHLFGGHGLCMGFWGCTDLKSGLLAIVETPDDARVNVPRRTGGCVWLRCGILRKASSGRSVVFATWPSIKAGTWPCVNGTASTLSKSAASRAWPRNAMRTPMSIA